MLTYGRNYYSSGDNTYYTCNSLGIKRYPIRYPAIPGICVNKYKEVLEEKPACRLYRTTPKSFLGRVWSPRSGYYYTPLVTFYKDDLLSFF